MRSAPHPHQRLLFPGFAVVWLAVAGWGLAQSAPPADGIQDETRALTPETHRQLAAELSQFRQDLKCDAWLKATSFMAAGTTLRRQAQITRREWSETRPAVLLAYDRASNSSAVSFAPVFWERYPAAELVETMQETRRILIDTKLSLDERLALATRALVDRLRSMESVRLRQSLWIQRKEKPFALAVPALLAGGALMAALFGLVSRRRTSRADLRFLFPEVQVGMRFGAPYGGGVTAEIKTNAGAQ
jgi:mRNA-degrading endonuclease toxin of MazEF toxin-antitoxin module